MSESKEFKKVYIGGAWVSSTGSGSLDVIDSNTEEVIGSIPEGTATDADKAVEAAAAAFPEWSATPAAERSKLLTRISEGLAGRTYRKGHCWCNTDPGAPA